MRLCIQVGRTQVWPSLRRVPWQWGYEQSLMGPLLFGIGIWVEHEEPWRMRGHRRGER